MKKGVPVLLVFLICLVVAGCGERAAPPEVAPTDTAVEAAEATPVPTEATAAPPTPTRQPPPPTYTLVIPVTPADAPVTEPTGAPAAPAAETPIPPTPTTHVAPELVELVEWAEGLEEELLQPIEEMSTTLEELIPDSGVPDIRTFCTGVEVVLASLAEAQTGLEQLGPPPTEGPDLLECWAELSAAVDDFEQCFLLLDGACETLNLADLPTAGVYCESGAQNLENAAEAFERWRSRTRF
jgi:hypothetical protein